MFIFLFMKSKSWQINHPDIYEVFLNPINNYSSFFLLIFKGSESCPELSLHLLDSMYLSCQNCPQGPPAEKTGRGSLLNCPSCPPDDPVSQGTEHVVK